MGARARCFPFLSGYLERDFCAGRRNSTELKSGAWLTAKKRKRTTSEWVLEELPKAFHALPADNVATGTSMLPGDKVLFFTKPPSVAQARPIRRQWLVNSSQSGGKPRRDRDHGAILLMNYLNGRNNNVSRPPLFWFRGRIFHAAIRILSGRRVRIFQMI